MKDPQSYPAASVTSVAPPEAETEAAVLVRDLRVTFPGLAHPAVDGIDLHINPGECVALVGESGSGKTVTSRALMGLSGGEVQARTLRVLGYQCAVRGRALRREKHWLQVRRAGISVITQDALAGLDPLRKVGAELADAARRHSRNAPQTGAGQPADQRIARVLEEVGLADSARLRGLYPHELSGGMRQRALVAAALLSGPRLLVADEATTALDSRLTNLVLDQVAGARERGVAVLMISHDLAQVAKVADRILVMKDGKIVESGSPGEVLHQPRHPYTQTLLTSIPTGVARFTPLLAPHQGCGNALAAPAQVRPRQGRDAPADPPPALELRSVVKTYRDVTAVKGVNLSLKAGKTLGLVGESGCGKTTTARLALGLENPDAGQVLLGGEQFSPLPFAQARALRHQLAAIYQNPLASFDPRYRCAEILCLAASAGRSRRWRSHAEEIMGLLREVGLDEGVARRFPHQLSGGQRQRLAIARALARQPRVLILDEPVSALDVTIQARVLDLLDEVQSRTGAALLFISHDLDVVEHMSDEVAVMHGGQVVEMGPTATVFNHPTDPYTRELLSQRLRLDR